MEPAEAVLAVRFPVTPLSVLSPASIRPGASLPFPCQRSSSASVFREAVTESRSLHCGSAGKDSP